MNCLLATLFLKESELIYLYTFKQFQVLLSNTHISICTQLNDFKYSK